MKFKRSYDHSLSELVLPVVDVRVWTPFSQVFNLTKRKCHRIYFFLLFTNKGIVYKQKFVNKSINGFLWSTEHQRANQTYLIEEKETESRRFQILFVLVAIAFKENKQIM